MTTNRAVTAKWMQTVRVLDAASVVLLVVAVVWLVWPASPTSPTSTTDFAAENVTPLDSASATNNGAATNVRQVTDSLVATIVQGNLFSASRRAPTARFSTPGLTGIEVPATPEPGSAVTADNESNVSADSVSLPHVSGIVVQQDVRMALIQFTESDAMPRLFREGDSHAGYRIVRIGDNHVIVAYRGESRTLRLTASAPPPSFPDTQELP